MLGRRDIFGDVGATGGGEPDGATPFVGSGGSGITGGGEGREVAEVLFRRSFDTEPERSARKVALVLESSAWASAS